MRRAPARPCASISSVSSPRSVRTSGSVTSVAELGYIGLGVMGGGVARRLLDAGHEVTGWNRTKSKAQPLLEAGMRWGESPRDVAERSEIVFTMVTNTAAVQAVTDGPDGILAGLAPGKIYVDMSTASPANTRRSEEHTSELQSHVNLVCRLLLEKKKKITNV